jgi:hypothetical protein
MFEEEAGEEGVVRIDAELEQDIHRSEDRQRRRRAYRSSQLLDNFETSVSGSGSVDDDNEQADASDRRQRRRQQHSIEHSSSSVTSGSSENASSSPPRSSQHKHQKTSCCTIA